MDDQRCSCTLRTIPKNYETRIIRSNARGQHFKTYNPRVLGCSADAAALVLATARVRHWPKLVRAPDPCQMTSSQNLRAEVVRSCSHGSSATHNRPEFTSTFYLTGMIVLETVMTETCHFKYLFGFFLSLLGFLLASFLLVASVFWRGSAPCSFATK